MSVSLCFSVTQFHLSDEENEKKRAQRSIRKTQLCEKHATNKTNSATT
jgi:hypothetical protein